MTVSKRPHERLGPPGNVPRRPLFWMKAASWVGIIITLCRGAHVIQGDPAMRIGLCASLTSAFDPPADLGYLEPKVIETLCPRESDEEFARRYLTVRSLALPVEALAVLFPGDMPLTGPAADERV